MSKENKYIPPKLATRFLRWYCRQELVDEVEGDLYELFRRRVETHGVWKAKVLYWLNVLMFLHPDYIRKRKERYPLNPMVMLRHNFIISFRSFQRHKTTFLINLMGLSSGLACALLIYLWVNDELSVDKFHEKDNQLYQVMQTTPDAHGMQTTEVTPGLLAKALAEELPEVEYATSVVPASWFLDRGTLAFEGRRIKTNGQYVGEDFFNIFSYDFAYGDKKQLLKDKYAVALSEELATKLFDSPENSMGKIVTWDKESLSGEFVVTGVFKKPPPNATQQFDLLFNYALFLEYRPFLQSWGNSDPHTYLLLKEGTDVRQFNEKIAAFLQTKDENQNSSLFVRKYSDHHLYNRYENGVQAGGRIEYVRLFSIIAAFILLIACINFMNLSTAKASRRTKEVGVKKAMGAARKTLIFQYLSESLLITLLSLIMALLIVVLLLPQFNELTGKALMLNFDVHWIGSVLGILLLTGLIAGSYPALYLSGFNPVAVLKGRLATSAGELWTRKGLVVFQFTLSIVLIVAVWVVYEQISFVQHKNLGYNRDNILHFEMEMQNIDDESFMAEGGIWEKRMEVYLQEVQNIPGVVNATNYYHDLTGNHGGLTGVDWEPGDQDEKLHFSNLEVGYAFIETLGMEMAAGRSFSREFNAERSKIILNESAIASMGLADPVGKTIRVWGEDKEIIGVAKDFHFESLYEEVKPCLFQLEPRCSSIMVKIQEGTEQETIAQLQNFYQQHAPGLAFDYQFLDQDYQALYASEQKVSVLSRYFAGLAMVISCLGLFGLAAFTAERRLKEIGIRKILGSSNMHIVRLLSADFTGMVLIAIVIALPVSYFITQRWLQDFAFSIDLEWWYFAGAGLTALLIAWLSVGFQTIKAARVNPVECLKDE